jgi:hypothetical protein
MVDHGSLGNRRARRGGRLWSADLKLMLPPCFRSNAPCTKLFRRSSAALAANDAFAALFHDGFRQIARELLDVLHFADNPKRSKVDPQKSPVNCKAARLYQT